MPGIDHKGFSGYQNSNFKEKLGGLGGEVVLTKGDMHLSQLSKRQVDYKEGRDALRQDLLKSSRERD